MQLGGVTAHGTRAFLGDKKKKKKKTPDSILSFKQCSHEFLGTIFFYLLHYCILLSL